jgi:hypothetical protein
VRGHMAVSLFALVFGALETGGAVQELVYRGVLNSETDPMIVGALGTVTGALLLWTGGALLIRFAAGERSSAGDGISFGSDFPDFRDLQM